MNYIQGSLLTIADTLSRAPLNNKKSEISNAELSSHIYLTESNYLISDFRLKHFKEETQSDKNLQYLLNYIQNGWPKSINDMSSQICNYFMYREELTYSNDIIFKDTPMIVPRPL